MERRRHKNLILILAREFASKLATPMLVTDAEGDLVFYNEPAEEVLGRSFSEVGEMPAEEWQRLFETKDETGTPVTLDEMPAGIAFRERQPAHGSLRIVGLDGNARTISVTAFPLFAHAGEFVGIVTIFWQNGDGGAG